MSESNYRYYVTPRGQTHEIARMETAFLKNVVDSQRGEAAVRRRLRGGEYEDYLRPVHGALVEELKRRETDGGDA